MTAHCADLTFGLSSQSLAILHLLAQREVEFAEVEEGHHKVHIETTPWYNGLEVGVALQVYRDWKKQGPCRIIVFGECREDDQIFIEYWDQTEPLFNSPTIDQREASLWPTEEVVRETLSRSETYRAADIVYRLMSEFYEAKEKDPPNNLVRMPTRLRIV